jgi:hypothetical protein
LTILDGLEDKISISLEGKISPKTSVVGLLKIKKSGVTDSNPIRVPGFALQLMLAVIKK